MPKNLDNHHPQPCANCGHRNLHGEVSGCIHVEKTPSGGTVWCDCSTYQAPSTKVGRTIPARNTDPGTSHAATASVVIKAGNQRTILLGAFAGTLAADRGGLTDEEAMETSEGVSPLSEFAKRCSELRDAGLIEPTGETRPGQSGVHRIVSRITEAGRLALEMTKA